MTMGALKADRRYVKKQILRKKVRRVILNWIARNGETIANVIFFIVMLLMLGAVGNIELSDGIPKSSIILMLLSTGYVAVFAVLRQGD